MKFCPLIKGICQEQNCEFAIKTRVPNLSEWLFVECSLSNLQYIPGRLDELINVISEFKKPTKKNQSEIKKESKEYSKMKKLIRKIRRML